MRLLVALAPVNWLRKENSCRAWSHFTSCILVWIRDRSLYNLNLRQSQISFRSSLFFQKAKLVFHDSGAVWDNRTQKVVEGREDPEKPALLPNELCYWIITLKLPPPNYRCFDYACKGLSAEAWHRHQKEENHSTSDEAFILPSFSDTPESLTWTHSTPPTQYRSPYPLPHRNVAIFAMGRF